MSFFTPQKVRKPWFRCMIGSNYFILRGKVQKSLSVVHSDEQVTQSNQIPAVTVSQKAHTDHINRARERATIIICNITFKKFKSSQVKSSPSAFHRKSALSVHSVYSTRGPIYICVCLWTNTHTYTHSHSPQQFLSCWNLKPSSWRKTKKFG